MSFNFILAFLLLLFIADACNEPNCVFCGRGAALCEKCKDGYKLTDHRCEACYDKNCLDCPDYYARCKVCNDNYRVAATTC